VRKREKRRAGARTRREGGQAVQWKKRRVMQTRSEECKERDPRISFPQREGRSTFETGVDSLCSAGGVLASMHTEVNDSPL